MFGSRSEKELLVYFLMDKMISLWQQAQEGLVRIQNYQLYYGTKGHGLQVTFVRITTIHNTAVKEMNVVQSYQFLRAHEYFFLPM